MSWERDEQSQTREICFEVRATCSMSPPSPLWRISNIIDPARSLGIATPTTSSLKNSWTRKSLTCSRKNNTREPVSSPRLHLYDFLNTRGEALVITSLDHKNKLPHNKDPWGWILQWKAQACVRKTRLMLWWKTQEISFENSRKTLLKNSLFDMEV